MTGERQRLNNQIRKRYRVWGILNISWHMGYNRIIPFREAFARPAPASIAAIHCPGCGSNWMPIGMAPKGCRVYHCGDCGWRTMPDTAYQRPGAADHDRALTTYQEGGSLGGIVRIFRGRRAGRQQVDYRRACRTVPDAPAGRKAYLRRGRRPAGGARFWRDADLPAGSAAG